MATAAEVYVMLGNENLWQAAMFCHLTLASGEIPHAVCGGVAVWLHGYQRNTTDLDLIVDRDRAGKDSEVRLPSPTGDLNVETIEGLPVLRLSRLIEIKIACGAENVRRMHKDFADVVELISIRKLDGSFATYLHKSVRDIYRKQVQNARGEA